jgi:hypothetical protein
MGAFATEVILVIAWNAAEDKPGAMPRICPACQVSSLIGHGWRIRQAHDASHTSIRIHRGICKYCSLTVTMLPAWLLPGGHYSLIARQQSAQLALEPASGSIEECIPDSRDPERCADPSTVRRWWQRRLWGLWAALRLFPYPVPTIFAWDWKAARRTLILEANSG